ncbi:hypothetical protein K438DRAFT_1555854, partial [Mycena galopus ATCC 62051]
VGFLVSDALAQVIRIGSPVNGTSVKAGSNITVEIQKPDTLTSSVEVVIVIGFVSCGSTPCPSPMDRVGDVLYNGPFHPAFHSGGGLPYQNFIVTIPTGRRPFQFSRVSSIPCRWNWAQS